MADLDFAKIHQAWMNLVLERYGQFDREYTASWGEPPSKDDGECTWHSWQFYEGATEKYWFCTKCDKKDFKAEPPRIP